MLSVWCKWDGLRMACSSESRLQDFQGRGSACVEGRLSRFNPLPCAQLSTLPTLLWCEGRALSASQSCLPHTPLLEREPNIQLPCPGAGRTREGKAGHMLPLPCCKCTWPAAAACQGLERIVPISSCGSLNPTPPAAPLHTQTQSASLALPSQTRSSQ